MEKWTRMKRQPENKIKMERNQGRSETNRLTAGEMKDGGRKKSKERREETREME